MLYRTTRNVTLTDIGKQLFDTLDNSHEELSDLLRLLSNQQEQPSGKLRINAPMAFGEKFLVDPISEYAKKFNVDFIEGKTPWEVKCDIALPCATQNELNADDAKLLTANGCFVVAEGANMPSTTDAVHHFINEKILFGPGKAANAGGVAVSGIEMSQNSTRMPLTSEEVDNLLKGIMNRIHSTCVKYGTKDDFINYVDGANIGGFVRVADSMIDQGIV